MKIKRKLELAEQAIVSITTHDDEDSAIRLGAIEHLKKFLDAEADGVKHRLQQKMAGKSSAEERAE